MKNKVCSGKGLPMSSWQPSQLRKFKNLLKEVGKDLKALLLIGRQHPPVLNGEQSGEDENELDEQGYDSGIYILNKNTQVM